MRKEQITVDDFKRYEAVRERGKYNMFLEARIASMKAGLPTNTYFCIMDNYRYLADKYQDKEGANQ